MGLSCLGIGLLIGVCGILAGGGSWLLANLVLQPPIPSWMQAFWYAAVGALAGMLIGAKVGSKSVLDSFRAVEEEIGVPVEGPGIREMATQSGSKVAAIGSLLGAAVGGAIWFGVALAG